MRVVGILKYVIMFVGLGLLVGGIYDVLANRAFVDESESLGGFLARWFNASIPIAIGGVISLIFAVSYAFKAYQKGLAIYLRLFGEAVRSTFVASRKNLLTSINHVHPFNIVSKWRNPLTGTTHEFTSPDLWFDLEGYVPPGEITVYIKPDNPGIYSMDRSFLSAKKPPPLRNSFLIRTDSEEEGGRNIPLRTAVRDNWPYLLGAPLFGPYMMVLAPLFGLPSGLALIVFFASLVPAMLPVGMRKAPLEFWFLAIGLWTAGLALGVVMSLFIELPAR